MSKYSVIILFLFFTLKLIAQKEEILVAFQVPIDENIYTFRTEVSNIHYLEFLHYVKEDSSKEYYESLLLKFDSKDTIFNEQRYFRYPRKRYHPVVYVSHEQATNYCEWLEDALIQRMEENEEIDRDKYLLNARLPTIEEWIKSALKYDYVLENTEWINNISSSPLDKSALKKIIKDHDLKLSKKEYYDEIIAFIEDNPIFMFENLKYKGDKDHLDYALNTKHPWPRKNPDDLEKLPYDLRGNVSELTSTKGIAKGGNWKTAPGEIGVMDNVKYLQPSNTIGFRCVCEFKEK